MKTKQKTITLTAVLLLVCLAALSFCGILCARAEDETDTNALVIGDKVQSGAVYGEELDANSVSFAANAELGDGESVHIGLMRAADTLPDSDYGERGLIYALRRIGDEYFLDVTGVELRSDVSYVKDYKLADASLNVEIARMKSGYKLSVNGVRIIDGYVDVLSALGASTFSLGGKTHLAVAVFGEQASVTVESVESSEEYGTSGAEWYGETSCVAAGSGNAVSLDGEAVRLSEAQNVAYTRVELSFAAQDGKSTYLAFASTVSAPLFAREDAGASGAVLRFRRVSADVYLDVDLHAGGDKIGLCRNLLLSNANDAVVELKKKSSLLGYVLIVNGTRITVSGKDVLDGVAKEDLGYFENASFTGTYVSAGSDGVASVKSVSQMDYDPYPIPNEKDIVNTSVYGANSENWAGEFTVTDGVMRSHSAVYLDQGLDTEYVGFELGLEALSDSATLDSHIAFGLSSEASLAAVSANALNAGNAVFFTLSKRNNTVYISGYVRYEGELKNFLPSKALDGVQAEDEMKVEFVYCDYDLALYINGKMLLTSYGSNPLDDYYSLYYESEDYLTYLCFGSYAYADPQKPTLTAQNCASYRVYGISNDLPESFAPSQLTATKSESVSKEKFEIYKVAIPCAVTLAVCIAAGAVIVVAYAKKKEGKQ